MFYMNIEFYIRLVTFGYVKIKYIPNNILCISTLSFPKSNIYFWSKIEGR